jgi:hypothetical protein
MSKVGNKINVCKELALKENESLLLDMIIET